MTAFLYISSYYRDALANIGLHRWAVKHRGDICCFISLSLVICCLTLSLLIVRPVSLYSPCSPLAKLFPSACECGGARVVVSLPIAHCQRSKVLVRLAVQEMQEIQPQG